MEYDTKDVRRVHAFIADEKGAINEDDHSILFAVSTGIVDRDREQVIPQAVFEAINRKGEFHANPICLPCHKHRLDSGMPPCVGSWDTETAKLLKRAVDMRLFYAAETELGLAYWKVYSTRHMRAVSLGFRILEIYTCGYYVCRRSW